MKKNQAVLEYTILFAVVTAALVGSAFFLNTDLSFKEYFRKSAKKIIGTNTVIFIANQ